MSDLACHPRETRPRCDHDGRLPLTRAKAALLSSTRSRAKSKIVVLDEVSANVDVKTDELMQRIIRKEFKDCTVIAVAHRLDTIVDFERVVVLGKGEIVEVGAPQMFLATEGSAFKGLYES